jgi:hypothetical protein
MALNDILKHMPGMGEAFSSFEPTDEMEFPNLSEYKVLSAPPFSNVSISAFKLRYFN